MKPVTRICLWSGPRNVSTALMYSFAQRADTRVIDEPLYAHYLRVSGADHPGRAVVLAEMDADGERVIRDVILGSYDRPILFMKQMAHHLVDLEWSFLEQVTNVLLIRDPTEMLTSLIHQLPNPSLRDTGLDAQVAIYDVQAAIGVPPPVLDARWLLTNPRGVLTRLCDTLGIAFDEHMLTWPAGGRPEDGVWARYWYDAVRRSTGFEPYRPKAEPMPDRLLPLLRRCMVRYERLRELAIRPE